MKTRLFCALLAATLVGGKADAASIAIAATPQESSGPFQHNVFHTANSAQGQYGSILAWFSMNGGGGSWDPVSGAFSLSVDLFSDAGLTAPIGTATGTGNLAAGAFNGNDGGLIGTISWSFDATALGNGLTDATLSFYDINYVTSSAGYTANSTTGSYSSLTLWGADGTADPNTGMFDTNTTSMGMDLVVTFVPVPAALWLFGSGLAGLAGLSLRGRRAA